MKYRLIMLLMIIMLVFFTVAVHNYMKTDIETTTEELIEKTEVIINDIENTNQAETNIVTKIVTKEELKFNDNLIGILEIPKLNIKAPVKEGTTQSILKYSVGHFPNSSNWNGNIALASHNRGDYVAHYFSNIHELVVGDEIIYKSKFGERRYVVENSKQIESTDWSVISNTKENRITLITCIKNQPHLRFCVQAVEIVEDA